MPGSFVVDRPQDQYCLFSPVPRSLAPTQRGCLLCGGRDRGLDGGLSPRRGRRRRPRERNRWFCGPFGWQKAAQREGADDGGREREREKERERRCAQFLLLSFSSSPKTPGDHLSELRKQRRAAPKRSRLSFSPFAISRMSRVYWTAPQKGVVYE